MESYSIEKLYHPAYVSAGYEKQLRSSGNVFSKTVAASNAKSATVKAEVRADWPFAGHIVIRGLQVCLEL